MNLREVYERTIASVEEKWTPNIPYCVGMYFDRFSGGSLKPYETLAKEIAGDFDIKTSLTDPKNPVKIVVSWNDSDDQTKENVLKTLRKVAETLD